MGTASIKCHLGPKSNNVQRQALQNSMFCSGFQQPILAPAEIEYPGCSVLPVVVIPLGEVLPLSPFLTVTNEVKTLASSIHQHTHAKGSHHPRTNTLLIW